MPSDSPQPSPRPPHPLALELIDRLRDRPGAAVLEIGRGSGRNTRALETAGFRVVDLDSDEIAAAALSTHSFLHGTPHSISLMLERVLKRLEPGAPFFVTFGSVRDARYGRGTRIATRVYAPTEGDERGVPHAFFDEMSLRRLLHAPWRIESLREERVDDVVGRWAHEQRPLHDAFHWFAALVRQE
ncbi:MAG: hypothetical protein JO322_12020 [Candidatus Eremiobacteraeota bacterium]|nr:hypothetical protein [Candidatus Eremiobacteraeota bacterium]